MGYDVAELEKAARKEARYAARVYARAFEMGFEDQEDLEQDLLLAVLVSAASYDRSKAALRTFASAVIRNEILHKMRQAKRDADNPVVMSCLHDEVPDGEESVPFHETLDRAKCKARLGIHEPDPIREADLRHDMALTLKHLTPRQRDVFHLLQRGTKVEAARETGVSRQTIYEDVKAIREAMEALGIDAYKEGALHCTLSREI